MSASRMMIESIGAAVVARDRPQRQSDDQRDRDGDDADEQRDSGRDEHAREDIASEVVGAERVGERRRRAESVGRELVVDRVGVVGSDVAAVEAGRPGQTLDGPDEQEHDDDAQAYDGELVALEASPRVGPQAQRLGRQLARVEHGVDLRLDRVLRHGEGDVFGDVVAGELVVGVMSDDQSSYRMRGSTIA